MKLSKLNIRKINFNDIDRKYAGQDILMKLGELYQFESGIYAYGNVWTKLEQNIEKIIIEELDRADCVQVEFPKLQPKEIWEKSHRWQLYTTEKDIMFTVNNNLGEYGLAPTAEECAALFAANRVISYKQLPTIYYQIGEKFRKEIRTRGYLFRPRTFVMMDAYSFDKTENDMVDSFNKMHSAYLNIFKRIGIDVIPTISDGGTIGGRVSEEFQAILPQGEDVILYSKENNIGINKEVLDYEDKDIFIKELNGVSLDEMQEVGTIELGNNFKLGTKYAKTMGLYFQDENGENKPFYMGCYGIGVGRILATLIENNIIIKNNQIKGFSIPYEIAPYKVHIIYNEDNKFNAFKLYENLLNNKIDCIIDDRENLSLGNRINDVSLLGTPRMIVLGSKFDNQNYEVEDLKSGTKELVNIDNIVEYLKNSERL